MDNQPNPVAIQPILTPQETQDTPPPKKKSLLWLWVTLIIITVLAVVGIVVYVMLHQGVQQTTVATDFMKALQNADREAIKKLSGQNPDSDSVKKVIDGLKDSKYTLKNSTVNNGEETFSFSVENSADIHDMTVTVKDSKVTATSLNTEYDAAQKQTKDNVAKAHSCITVDDFKANNIDYIDNISLKSQATSDSHRGYFADYYFEVNSATYAKDSYIYKELQKVASFYENTKTKNYSFVLQGTEHQTSANDINGNVATQRSQNIKNDLVSLGVDANKITIDAPVIDDHPSVSEIDRKVILDIVIPAECAGAY